MPSRVTTGAMILGGCIAGLIVSVITLVVMLFLIRVMWAWTIPDLFPGAVQQGLVAESISWLTAFKLALFLAILTGIMRVTFSHRDDAR